MQDLNQVVCLSEWVNLLKVDLQKATCMMKKICQNPICQKRMLQITNSMHALDLLKSLQSLLWGKARSRGTVWVYKNTDELQTLFKKNLTCLCTKWPAKLMLWKKSNWQTHFQLLVTGTEIQIKLVLFPNKLSRDRQGLVLDQWFKCLKTGISVALLTPPSFVAERTIAAPVIILVFVTEEREEVP